MAVTSKAVTRTRFNYVFKTEVGTIPEVTKDGIGGVQDGALVKTETGLFLGNQSRFEKVHHGGGYSNPIDGAHTSGSPLTLASGVAVTLPNNGATLNIGGDGGNLYDFTTLTFGDLNLGDLVNLKVSLTTRAAASAGRILFTLQTKETTPVVFASQTIRHGVQALFIRNELLFQFIATAGMVETGFEIKAVAQNALSTAHTIDYLITRVINLS